MLDDAFGGAIRLQVADEQADAAKAILAEAERALAAEDPDEKADEKPADQTG